MDSMTLFLDIIAMGCGVYCLYTWAKLLFTKKLFKNGILVPKEKQIEDCLDEEGYIKAVLPPLGVLAIVTTLYGIFFMINDNLAEPLIPYPWNFIPLVLVTVILFWYGWLNSKMNKEFWGM